MHTCSATKHRPERQPSESRRLKRQSGCSPRTNAQPDPSALVSFECAVAIGPGKRRVGKECRESKRLHFATADQLTPSGPPFTPADGNSFRLAYLRSVVPWSWLHPTSPNLRTPDFFPQISDCPSLGELFARLISARGNPSEASCITTKPSTADLWKGRERQYDFHPQRRGREDGSRRRAQWIRRRVRAVSSPRVHGSAIIS